MGATWVFGFVTVFLTCCLLIGTLTPQQQPDIQQTLLYIPPIINANTPTPQQNNKLLGELVLTYTGTNLGVIPTHWAAYATEGKFVYGADPQIIFYDTTETHNSNPSIRIEAHQDGVDVNSFRECDLSSGISIVEGDHIYMEVYVKTGESTLGQNGVVGNGAIFGVDLYGGSPLHRMREVSSSNSECFLDSDWWTYLDDPTQYTPFNSDWTLKTLDFIVPSEVYDESTAEVSTGPITAIIPWVQGASYITGPSHLQDQGWAWFSDIKIYVNPTVVSDSLPLPVASMHLINLRR